MVTAGVYLLIRSSPLIEYSNIVLLSCLWLGTITTVFSSLIGLFQQDIKKIIAYSTMSQLARECNIHLIILRHQTIYAEFIFNNLYQIIDTINSQITKAHGYLFNSHISYNLFNSLLINWLYYYIYISVIMSVKWKIIILSKLVRISEAIRLILIFVIFIKNNHLFFQDILISGIWCLFFYFNKATKSIINKNFICSSLRSKNNKLNPYYVTGFTDPHISLRSIYGGTKSGEGCFLINIRPNLKLKTGYSVELVFKLALHFRDKSLLTHIKNYFEVGTITERTDGYIQYWIGSIKDLEIIVKHFDTYPLITQKWSDYTLFKQVFVLMKCKEHLTREGLKKIVLIKSVLNNGLSNELKIAFPDIVPVIRPLRKNQVILDPHWMAGFVDAEGCFHIAINPSSNKAGGTVHLKFLVSQHSRDKGDPGKGYPCPPFQGLNSFIDYFDCGNYFKKSSNEMAGEFIVTKFKDVYETRLASQGNLFR